MGQCGCGHTRDAEKNCDGSHKIAKKVKQEIVDKLIAEWKATDNPENLTYADGLADAVAIARGDKK